MSSRNSQQGVRRGVSGGSGVPRSGSPIGGPPFNNRSEKESAVNLVKQLSHPHEPEPAQLQRELTQQVNERGKHGSCMLMSINNQIVYRQPVHVQHKIFTYTEILALAIEIHFI